jgi:transcriptional regulator with XRE-family HTH domain
LIGKAVMTIRTNQKLTQEDLAGRLAAVGWNVSRDTVQRIESGQREVTDIDLRFLAKGLRVPVGEFFQ